MLGRPTGSVRLALAADLLRCADHAQTIEPVCLWNDNLNLLSQTTPSDSLTVMTDIKAAFPGTHPRAGR
jgi:hypothetical protein